MRKLTAAASALDDALDPERRRLLAMRAAFSLPYDTLLSYSPDPLGALAAGDYEPLVRAMFEDSGLKPPGRSQA